MHTVHRRHVGGKNIGGVGGGFLSLVAIVLGASGLVLLVFFALYSWADTPIKYVYADSNECALVIKFTDQGRVRIPCESLTGTYEQRYIDRNTDLSKLYDR